MTVVLICISESGATFGFGFPPDYVLLSWDLRVYSVPLFSAASADATSLFQGSTVLRPLLTVLLDSRLDMVLP